MYTVPVPVFYVVVDTTQIHVHFNNIYTLLLQLNQVISYRHNNTVYTVEYFQYTENGKDSHKMTIKRLTPNTTFELYYLKINYDVCFFLNLLSIERHKHTVQVLSLRTIMFKSFLYL